MTTPTSNLRTTLADADARLVSRGGDTLVPGDMLVRKWEEIDIASAKTLMDTQLAITVVTNPVVDGVTVTGTFAVSDIVQTDDERRWATITQSLTKVTNVAAGALEGELPNPIVVYRETNLEQFAISEGAEDNITYTYNYLNPVDRDIFMGIAITAPSVAWDDTNVEEVDRQFSVGAKGDRTGTMTVLFRSVTWDNVVTAGAPAVETQMSESGTNSEDNQGQSRIDSALNVDAQDAVSVMEYFRDEDLSATGWYMTDVTIREGSDGSATVTRKVDRSNQTFATDSNYLQSGETNDPLHVIIGFSRYYPRLTPTQADDLINDDLRTGSLTIGTKIFESISIQRDSDPSSGLVTVRQQLGIIYNYGTEVAPNLPTVEIEARTATLEQFSLGEGSDDVRTKVYRYLDPADEATYFAVAVTYVGYTEVDRRFDIERDALGRLSGTLRVVFRAVTWDNTVSTGSPSVETQTSESGTNSEHNQGQTRIDSAINVDACYG